MLEYLDNPEATSATLKDGWCHTGDLGYYDQVPFVIVIVLVIVISCEMDKIVGWQRVHRGQNQRADQSERTAGGKLLTKHKQLFYISLKYGFSTHFQS